MTTNGTRITSWPATRPMVAPLKRSLTRAEIAERWRKAYEGAVAHSMGAVLPERQGPGRDAEPAEARQTRRLDGRWL